MEAIAELEAAGDSQSLLWAEHLHQDAKTLRLLAQTERLLDLRESSA